MGRISFDSLDECNRDSEIRRPHDVNPFVVCVFKTERFGYLQVTLTKFEDGWRLSTPAPEPDMNMFSDSDVNYIERVCRIVWRMVHDAPAATARFE